MQLGRESCPHGLSEHVKLSDPFACICLSRARHTFPLGCLSMRAILMQKITRWRQKNLMSLSRAISTSPRTARIRTTWYSALWKSSSHFRQNSIAALQSETKISLACAMHSHQSHRHNHITLEEAIIYIHAGVLPDRSHQYQIMHTSHSGY